MASSQDGFLLISDITGYTLYLSSAELQHAQEILAALLELLVEYTKPPLVISDLAGDAVVSYALKGDALQGQTFVEMIETTYVAFRRAIELMVLNNSCQCNACANISALDLKFFIHHGPFMVQRVAGREELVGSDVILIHRLLKNHVTEQTGIRAYTLYTASAIRQLGLEDFQETLVPHTEEYEHLGEVEVWVQDMHPIWEEKRATTRLTIPPERVSFQIEFEIAMPPYLVWDYLSRPEFRVTLLGSDGMGIADRKQGRIARGTVFHCYHGDKTTPETILEWEPFEQITAEADVPLPLSRAAMLETLRLVPTEKGTRLVQTFSKARGPWLGRTLCDFVFPRMMARAAQRDIEAFRAHIEGDLAARGIALAPETELPPERIGGAAAASLAEQAS